MITPTQFLNTPSFSGMLSQPLITPYSLLNLNNLSSFTSTGISQQVTTDTDKNQIAQPSTDSGAQNVNWLTCWYLGQGCPNQNPDGTFKGGLLDGLTGSITEVFKNFGLMALALILIAFGLYLLANSTDTGKTVINVAKLAAV